MPLPKAPIDRDYETPPEQEEERRNWGTIALAVFVIVLLIGSLVVFFVLYLLSFL